MRIIASVALHYGKCYLNHAIRSIIDDVDSLVILYSPVGSHGHRTDVPCPDTRDELYDIALASAGEKLRWFDGQWTHEGQQRDSIYDIVPDADCIVVIDSDECWPPGLLREAIEATKDRGVRDIRVSMIHYWRSMKQAILNDPAYPVRIIYPCNKSGSDTFVSRSYVSLPDRAINHYGYALRSELVRYKWLIHGHLNEQRKDVDWFHDIFMNPLRTTDLHPVGSDFWQWETVDVPTFMQDHPYANLEIIP